MGTLSHITQLVEESGLRSKPQSLGCPGPREGCWEMEAQSHAGVRLRALVSSVPAPAPASESHSPSLECSPLPAPQAPCPMTTLVTRCVVSLMTDLLAVRLPHCSTRSRGLDLSASNSTTQIPGRLWALSSGPWSGGEPLVGGGQ